MPVLIRNLRLKSLSLAILAASFLMMQLVSSQLMAQEAIIRYNGIGHPVIGKHGMVASQNDVASQVGADILKQGGNAVDAAVAVGFALAVTLPRAGNLGGGGFMMVHLTEENKTIAIDYREMAPAAATRDMFLDKDGNVDNNKARFSHLSSGVPGTVMGMHHALTKYGTMSWEQVIEPARKLAADGIIVSHDLAQNLAGRKRLQENKASCAAYFKANCVPYEYGELLVQEDLAWSFKEMQDHGPDAFYKGEIAKKIAAEMAKAGGVMTMADLANYKAVERKPVQGSFKGYDVISMPPPSSGGVHIIQMLNMLDSYPLAEQGVNTASTIHAMVEVMKRAYADRSIYLGDPDFVDVPMKKLMAPEYAKELNQDIQECCITPSEKIRPTIFPGYESPDTTHYSVMDRWGNAVSNTYTLNFSYGSGVTIPGTGILMNNEMDDFSAKPGIPNAFGLIGGESNAIEPAKRPLSSMTPTFVFKDGKPYIVTGSPGGSRIITTVLQIILNVLVHDLNIEDATHTPRIHHQWYPDVLFMEPGHNMDVVRALESKGYKIRRTWSMGSTQSIVYKDGLFFGSADPRRPNAGAIPVN